jgi:hypothetical protein
MIRIRSGDPVVVMMGTTVVMMGTTVVMLILVLKSKSSSFIAAKSVRKNLVSQYGTNAAIITYSIRVPYFILFDPYHSMLVTFVKKKNSMLVTSHNRLM